MFAYKIFVVLITILYISPLSDAYKNYNKTHYVFLEEWGPIDVKSKDGRVMYSNCTTKAASVKNCTVVVEKTAYSNDSYACDISLRSDHAKGTIGRKMKLLGGLGDDKALLFWQENNKRLGRYFTYGILNLENCKFATANLDKRSVHHKTAVVLYDNSFDVFFKNKTVCGEKICRVTFDADGRVLKEPHGYIEGSLVAKGLILEPISTKSPDDGHFYATVEASDVNCNTTTAYYLVKGGTQKLLARVNGKPEVSVSITNKLITACTTYKNNKSYINCTQFDTEGNILSATSLLRQENKKKRVLAIKNTAEGNIVVLYKTVSDSNGLANSNSRVTLEKLNSDGRALGTRIIQDYCSEAFDMSEDKEGNYCILNGCIKEPDNMWGEKEMNFNYQCFNDTDLL